MKAKDSSTLEIYQSYIRDEISRGEPARIQCIFERALQEHCLVLDLWLQYTKYLVSSNYCVCKVCDQISVG